MTFCDPRRRPLLHPNGQLQFLHSYPHFVSLLPPKTSRDSFDSSHRATLVGKGDLLAGYKMHGMAESPPQCSCLSKHGFQVITRKQYLHRLLAVKTRSTKSQKSGRLQNRGNAEGISSSQCKPSFLLQTSHELHPLSHTKQNWTCGGSNNEKDISTQLADFKLHQSDFMPCQDFRNSFLNYTHASIQRTISTLH